MEAVAVDPAVTIAVPAPKSPGVTEGAMAAAAILRFLATIVAVAELLAVRVGPSGQFAAITSDVEVFKVDEL